MLRQIGKHRHVIGVTGLVLFVLATIGITAAAGKPERSPECAQLARIISGHGRTMLDGRRIPPTERQAYNVCVQDPAAFRRLLRFG